MQSISLQNRLRRQLLRSVGALGLASGLPAGWAQVGSGGSGSPAGNAPDPAAGGIGVADFVNGGVRVTRGGNAMAAETGMALQQGDLIETGRGAELHAKFNDGGYLAVRQGSAVRIDQYVAQGEPSDVAALNLLRGALRSVTGWIGKIGTPDKYRIVTSTATIGVRGTDHEVVIVPDALATDTVPAGTHDRVNEGATTLTSEHGNVEIAKGAAGFAPRNGEAPRLHASVPPFFNRLRTPNEGRVQQYKQVQRSFMEGQLRQRGKLGEGQSFQQFVQKHRRGTVGNAGASANPAADRASRQAQHEQVRQQREQARKQKQEQAAQLHPHKPPHPKAP